MENSINLNGFKPDLENLETVFKSRRSYRHYQNKDVSLDVIKNIINTAGYAPTGKNARGVQYTVIDNSIQMNKFKNTVKAAMKKVRDEKLLPEGIEFVYDYINLWVDSGIDIFFRDSPHLLITSASKEYISPETDAVIATAYFDVIAQASGLGTYWNGLVKFVLDYIIPEIKVELGIPENHIIGYTISFGYPAIKYQRTVQREQLKIHSAKLN